jgi:predicted MPP superfamily phosphohydrolase
MVERLETKSSLVVSGHSHGGQVCLPFGIALYTPYGARKYIAGYYAEARTPLFVSRGVGVNRGIRYNCPPEVNILTLNPETDEG